MGKNKSSRVHPPYKTKYRVDNWREYEAGLRARGDITVWFKPKAIASWTPQKTDVVSGGDSLAAIARDATVGRVREVGLRQWKKESGYHQQGRAENTFFRYKRIFGGHLRARGPEAQAVELRLACKVLNRMLELGAPLPYAIGR